MSAEVIQFIPRKRVVEPIVPVQTPEAEELEFYEDSSGVRIPVDRSSGLLIVDADELLAEVTENWSGIKSGISKLEAAEIEDESLRDRYDRVRGNVTLCYAACSIDAPACNNPKLRRGNVLISKNQLKHVQSVVPTLKELAADVQVATQGLGNLVLLRRMAS
jgi:hypothetical protein